MTTQPPNPGDPNAAQPPAQPAPAPGAPVPPQAAPPPPPPPPAAAPAPPAPAAPVAQAPVAQAPVAAAPAGAVTSTLPGAPAPTAGGRRNSTVKLLAIIFGSILGLGLLGGIAAAALGGDDEPEAEGIDTIGAQPVPGNGPEVPPPPAPAPVPGPGTEPTEPAAPTPTAEPSETTDPGTVPSEEPVEPVSSTGDVVEVGAGVSFAVAEGWSLSEQVDGYVEVGTGSEWFSVEVVSLPAGQDVGDVLIPYLEAMGGFIQNLEVTPLEDPPLPNGNVTRAIHLSLSGLVADGQGGATPIQGFVFVFARADGTAVIVDGATAQESLDAVADDFNAMLNSVAESL